MRVSAKIVAKGLLAYSRRIAAMFHAHVHSQVCLRAPALPAR
jgi:hypothetical protein